MESVRSPEEEVKLNTTVPAPHLNSYKGLPSLEEAWKPAVGSCVASDHAGSECNKETVTDIEESNYVSVKPYLPSVIYEV